MRTRAVGHSLGFALLSSHQIAERRKSKHPPRRQSSARGSNRLLNTTYTRVVRTSRGFTVLSLELRAPPLHKLLNWLGYSQMQVCDRFCEVSSSISLGSVVFDAFSSYLLQL